MTKQERAACLVLSTRRRCSAHKKINCAECLEAAILAALEARTEECAKVGDCYGPELAVGEKIRALP